MSNVLIHVNAYLSEFFLLFLFPFGCCASTSAHGHHQSLIIVVECVEPGRNILERMSIGSFQLLDICITHLTINQFAHVFFIKPQMIAGLVTRRIIIYSVLLSSGLPVQQVLCQTDKNQFKCNKTQACVEVVSILFSQHGKSC